MQAIAVLDLQAIREQVDELCVVRRAPGLGQPRLSVDRCDENPKPFAEGIVAKVVKRRCRLRALQQLGDCAHAARLPLTCERCYATPARTGNGGGVCRRDGGMRNGLGYERTRI